MTTPNNDNLSQYLVTLVPAQTTRKPSKTRLSKIQPRMSSMRLSRMPLHAQMRELCVSIAIALVLVSIPPVFMLCDDYVKHGPLFQKPSPGPANGIMWDL